MDSETEELVNRGDARSIFDFVGPRKNMGRRRQNGVASGRDGPGARFLDGKPKPTAAEIGVNPNDIQIARKLMTAEEAETRVIGRKLLSHKARDDKVKVGNPPSKKANEMFFNRRKRYNGRVAALLPGFGIQDSDYGVFSLLGTLDIAWERNYTEHEAALLVAYTVYGGMMKAGEARAVSVKSSISRIQDDWVAKGAVTKDLVARFSEKVDEWESKKSSSEAKAEGFPAEFPDFTESEPIAVFDAERYVFAYSKDLHSVGEKYSETAKKMKFPLAMAAINKATGRPYWFIYIGPGAVDSNPELFRSEVFEGPEGGYWDPTFYTSNMSGAIRWFGGASDYLEEKAFIEYTSWLACLTLGLDQNSVQRVDQ